LVGQERDEPDTSPEAEAGNFTNELGALGGIRFLKNVAGYWMLNECLRKWDVADMPAVLVAAAHDVPTFDATDPALLAPSDMEVEVRRLAHLPPDSSRATVASCIISSMATTTASVIEQLDEVRDVVLLGGGARDDVLRDRIAQWT